MRPFMVVGSSDKSRYDWALNIAREQNFHFIVIPSKEFASHEKEYFTSTLDEALCLFYLEDFNKLSISESIAFAQLIEKSPHRFVVASPSFPSYSVQKWFLVKPLGEAKDEISFALKQLQCNPDRNSVRLLISNSDPIHLFHILKIGAWINQDQLDTMIRISRNLYKCNSIYILDALVFALKAKPFRISKKPKVDEMQINILKKLKKALPNYTSSEIADVFHLLASGTMLGSNIELTDEEKAYLGIHDKVEQTQEIFIRTANLEDYF